MQATYNRAACQTRTHAGQLVKAEPRAAYQRTRAAHLTAVRAALEEHVTRLDWSRQRIEDYQNHRLRALLAYARERSPFHARRLKALDPSSATVADLASLPMMTKQEAQEQWDAIVTAADLDRADAERILVEQQWFSYTPDGQQIFSSGGSSGVRGVYVWDWQFFVSAACLAWRMQAREERRRPGVSSRLAVLEAGVPPHASTPLFDIPTAAGMETVVIAAGAPFDEVLAAVATAQPTHLVGYSSVIGRLARATLAGDLRIEPVRVSTNSEPLLDEDRQAISEAWGAPIHNVWGSTEIGVQAVGCGHGEGLHVCEDEIIIERVDDSGTPVGPDEPAARTLGYRAEQLDLPVHPLRPRRPGHLAGRGVRMRRRIRARRRHRRATRRRLPLRGNDGAADRVSACPGHRSPRVGVSGYPDCHRGRHRGGGRARRLEPKR